MSFVMRQNTNSNQRHIHTRDHIAGDLKILNTLRLVTTSLINTLIFADFFSGLAPVNHRIYFVLFFQVQSTGFSSFFSRRFYYIKIFIFKRIKEIV
jgi:hypothetical protein